MKFIFCITLLFCLAPHFSEAAGLSRNKPRQKVTDAQTVTIKESYSVGLSGLETESFRIQKILFKGKNTVYMVARLVNGEIYLEKTFNSAGYTQLKSAISPLVNIPNSDLCTKPVTIRTLRDGSETVNKVCGEKQDVDSNVQNYISQAKSFIGEK